MLRSSILSTPIKSSTCFKAKKPPWSSCRTFRNKGKYSRQFTSTIWTFNPFYRIRIFITPWKGVNSRPFPLLSSKGSGNSSSVLELSWSKKGSNTTLSNWSEEAPGSQPSWISYPKFLALNPRGLSTLTNVWPAGLLWFQLWTAQSSKSNLTNTSQSPFTMYNWKSTIRK